MLAVQETYYVVQDASQYCSFEVQFIGLFGVTIAHHNDRVHGGIEPIAGPTKWIWNTIKCPIGVNVAEPIDSARLRIRRKPKMARWYHECRSKMSCERNVTRIPKHVSMLTQCTQAQGVGDIGSRLGRHFSWVIFMYKKKKTFDIIFTRKGGGDKTKIVPMFIQTLAPGLSAPEPTLKNSASGVGHFTHALSAARCTEPRAVTWRNATGCARTVKRRRPQYDV